jgi:hypothetical protein
MKEMTAEARISYFEDVLYVFGQKVNGGLGKAALQVVQ